MFGHITKYTRKRKDKDGEVTGTLVRWRARYPDPDGVKATDQIERVFVTKGEAREWLIEQSAKVSRGEHVAPRASNQTFATVAEEWRGTWADLEPKTRVGYTSILGRHVLPAFGHRKVGSITPADVQAFVASLGVDLAPNTVRRVMDVLRNILRVAVERRYIVVNPCDPVRLPKRTSRNGRNIDVNPLTTQEFNTLVAALPEHWRLPATLAVYTGLRAGELWALRRGDIRINATELVVDEAIKEVTTQEAAKAPAHQRLAPSLIIGPTKTHSIRVVSIPQSLRPALIATVTQPLPGGTKAPASQQFIFTTPGGEPVRHGNFYRRIFEPVVRDTFPGRKFRWHDLRHTCAAWLIEDGAHPLQIKQRLGHESIRTTMDTYGSLFPSAEAALADKLDARLRQTPADKVVAIR